MKFYHYAPKINNVGITGILSVSRIPKELKKYAPRVGSDLTPDIIRWLEQSFTGRTRAISVLTEPIKWKGNDPMLKEWIKGRQLIAIDWKRLSESGLVDSVWCKNGSDSLGCAEKIYRICDNQINCAPLPWEKCSKGKGLFFGAVRHYFLVMKDGLIPPEYLEIVSEK